MKFSIITICYNDKEGLQHTLKSVAEQSFKNFQYIVVDGGSSDGSQEILEDFEDLINVKISEPDKGIYDAMNKGIASAKGDYLIFMNAGDTFYEINTLDKVNELIATAESNKPDVVYGEAMFVDENRNEIGTRSEVYPHKLPKKLNWKSLKMGMVVCHQSFFVKREICPKYDLKFSLSSDIDWMITVLKESKTIINSELIISRYLVGGSSRKQVFRSWKERFQVLAKHYGFFPTFYRHLKIVLRSAKFILTRGKGY